MKLDLQGKLDEILALPRETEWVVFKHNNVDTDAMGQYLSALSNSAALHNQSAGYLVWGIEDSTHRCVGTTFRPEQKTKGAEPLENWLLNLLTPRIDFTFHTLERDGATLVLCEIPAANSAPASFKGERFIRVGQQQKKLKEFPEKERKLWFLLTGADWSGQVVESADLSDLDTEAVSFARTQYTEKYPHIATEIETWDDTIFLNKAKVCIRGKITNAALLLLGKEESAHLLAPAVAELSWILRYEKGQSQDYKHFGLPMILSSNQILSRVRNLTVRHLPSGTLFPQEVSQYDQWVMREILHNCIAHQDYSLRGRISIVETPDSLLFRNLGSFIPGTVEEMIRSNSPPAIYRNKFLSLAMVNLNMIDTIGSGITKMFTLQRARNFPMPDYVLNIENEVSVKLAGQILDEKYTQLLMARNDLDLMDVIALDKVQKKHALNDDEFVRLKKMKLIEGRRTFLYVSAHIASAVGDKATYIKNRGLDKNYNKALVVSYFEKYKQSTRSEIGAFLIDKISDALAPEQKENRIKNLLQEMRREGILKSQGHGKGSLWELDKPVVGNKNLDDSKSNFG